MGGLGEGGVSSPANELPAPEVCTKGGCLLVEYRRVWISVCAPCIHSFLYPYFGEKSRDQRVEQRTRRKNNYSK